MSQKIIYGERESQAVHSVLIEIGQVLGSFLQKFVVVGGAVPWLLLPDAQPAHVGTIDIDLNLDPEALGGGEYASLVEALEARGYERGKEGLKPFQLRRWVQLDSGPPVGVIVDLLMPRGARGDRNATKLLTDFRVQGVDAGNVPLLFNVTQTIEGTMPDGRMNEVSILVASIPALLAMKGWAIAGRDKDKDAYDIYFSIRNHPDGPIELANECQQLLDIPEARDGYAKLASKFRDAEDYGPQTVRRFCEESNAMGNMTPDQIEEDAFRQVIAFVRALGLI